MSGLYRLFARDWEHCLDFSDEMLIELYNGESYGTYVSQKNGFAHGKKMLSLHVTMWKEDIAQGILFKHELYGDPQFPHWWLDSIFK